MSKILDLKDGKVVFTVECLLIEPFSTIWENDKSKDKLQANDAIRYIWFYTDYESPYFQFPEEDRSKLIIKDIIKSKDFKVSKEIKEAIIKYKQLTTSPAVEALDAAFAFIDKIHKYFKSVNLEDVDATKITTMFGNMPKIIASLNEAKNAAEREQSSSNKVRGEAKLGIFEDK